MAAVMVLYMAGSLRYRWIKQPWFNAHNVQCKNTRYAHCMHFSRVKYTCLQYNVVLKKQLETHVNWKLRIRQHCGCRLCAVHGRIAAITLDKISVIHCTFCVMQKHTVCTLCAVFPCKIRSLTDKLSFEKAAWNSFNIEHRVYGYILVVLRVLYMAGSLRYRGIKHPWFDAHFVQCKNIPYSHCMHSFYV